MQVPKNHSYERARAEIQARILSAIEADHRVIGCLDYGSTGHGKGDRWSDLDLAIIIRDEALASFSSEWQEWAAQFGDLLLAYSSFVGHPWAVYDTGAIPLRVDFSFKPASFLPELIELPLSPSSIDQMVLYDETAESLSKAVGQLIGKSLEPTDLHGAFTQASGDLWYMLLRCHTRLLRRQFWAARNDFHALVLHNLLALLRIESGATENWLVSNPADGIEEAIGQERLVELKGCIPDRDDRDLERAMSAAAELGASVCGQIHLFNGWSWPEMLAEQIGALFRPGVASIGGLSPVTMTPIGFIRNDIDELLPPKEIKAVSSCIVVDPTLEAGLDGLTKNQRLLVVFQFHRLAGFELHQHPKNNQERPKRGVFALHSPRRPNPIGVTEVDLLRREGNILHVRGLDAVNGTPVLDLKLNSGLQEHQDSN